MAAGIQPTRRAGGCSNSNEDTDTLHLMPQAHLTMPNQRVQGKLHSYFALPPCRSDVYVIIHGGHTTTIPTTTPTPSDRHTRLQGEAHSSALLPCKLPSHCPNTASCRRNLLDAVPKNALTPNHRWTVRCAQHSFSSLRISQAIFTMPGRALQLRFHLV